MKIEFEVIGTSPLLMHNPAGMSASNIGVGTKKIPTPEEEARAGTYKLDSGQLYLPCYGFHRGILNASAGRRIGTISAKRKVQGSLFITEDKIPISHPATWEPIMTWDEIDIRTVVIQRHRIIRARAKINEWGCHVIFDCDEEFLKPKWVEELFHLAGKTQGMLDYRPACGGPFGRYTIRLVE